MQLPVELLDRARLHLQRRVRVLPDLAERKSAPRLALGVELDVPHLPFDLVHAVGTLPMHRMDPRQLKEIMNQGATRPETARDRAERRVLEADLADSPVTGKPLRLRLRNFRPDAESAVRALGGPTIWMRRLLAIEEALDQHERQLEEAWRELAAEASHPAAFAARWRDLAHRWSFAEVNELIERHNRNFPAEARLPMDPRTRDFVRINGEHYEREPLDAEWILARFPADLRSARQ